MADYKKVIELAELGLEGRKEELVSLLKEIASEEINKNRHSLYNGLKVLIERHQSGIEKNHIQTSAGELVKSNSQFHFDANEIWLSSSLEKKIDTFISFYQSKDKLGLKSMSHLNKILLYGSPGTGKTTLGFYIAKKLGKNLKYIKISDVVSSKFGETLKNISDLFTSSTEEIIFIDEFDAFAKNRGDGNDVGELKRIVNSIIQTLDFQAHNKIVIVSTNLVETIDPAILRRFPFKIFVDVLEDQDKVDFFQFLISIHSDYKIFLTVNDIKLLVDIANLQTVDEIRTLFDKALIWKYINHISELRAENFLELVLTEGYLDRRNTKTLKKNNPKVLSALGKQLEKSGYSKQKVANILGIHRNSYKNYIN